MKDYFKSVEYLRESRKNLWNADYFAFLVQQVWKINKPLKIIDFGCGMGYLGAVLLPLLPQGSTYTGIDASAALLEQARAAFNETGWQYEFIEQDITRYEPAEQYDLAICQAVLVHIPYPATVLKKMAQSVTTGGRVICIEPNWAFTNIGIYRHGMETYSYQDWHLYQKLFDTELNRTGVDRYIGIKIPALMRELGLGNIDIRINDKANFTVVTEAKQASTIKTAKEQRENRFDDLEFYKNAGLDSDEAEHHLDSMIRTNEFMDLHTRPMLVVDTPAWLISYGEK